MRRQGTEQGIQVMGTEHVTTSGTQTTMPAGIPRLAIVVVTYKRQELLADLFASFEQLTCAPWRIVIVDNENASQTEQMVADLNRRLEKLWGAADADAKGEHNRAVYAPQTENLGGAGGFSAGVRCAFERGASWFWVMDDDVTVMPDGIEKLAHWIDRFDVIQGSRLDFDGGDFYWQYSSSQRWAFPTPSPKPTWAPKASAP